MLELARARADQNQRNDGNHKPLENQFHRDDGSPALLRRISVKSGLSPVRIQDNLAPKSRNRSAPFRLTIAWEGSSGLKSKSSSWLAELDPARVCIIKPSSLGDVVHALPILAALRARWPTAHLAWVVNRPFRELLDGHPDLDELMVHERSARAGDFLGLSATTALFRKLSQSQFDLTIDLQGLLRSALMTAATRSPVRVGLADAREGATWFYTHSVDASRLHLHAVERTRLVAMALGANMPEPHFDLPISASANSWACETLAGLRSPRVILNVGARWLTKRWPPHHFAALGRRLVATFQASLIAVGSASDRPLVQALLENTAPTEVLDLCGRTSLNQLAALSAQADLLISNDTGPLHLAAAAGARVIGIYTCTNPALTGPFGPRATTVQTGIWCKCSLRKTCDRMECMSELTPERIWPTVEQQIKSAISTRAVVS
jgi:lipopolysaccharide heptosyltransferase I